MQQADSSRVLRESYISGRSSPQDALKHVKDAVANALILHPDMPAIHLAEVLMKDEEPEVGEQLSEILKRDFYVRAVLADRRARAAANRAQAILPGFEHLPLRIRTPKGARVRLMDANYTAVKSYYWSLMASHTSRKRNDPKIKEAKKLLETMRKRSRTERGITVREVFVLDR